MLIVKFIFLCIYIYIYITKKYNISKFHENKIIIINYMYQSNKWLLNEDILINKVGN